MSRPVKRSFSIKGHRTSISLETAFWSALKEAASERNVPVTTLIAGIDAERGTAGLSSAVRIWILQYYRERAQAADGQPRDTAFRETEVPSEP